MAAQPLTKIQKTVLTQIFRDRVAAPRSIAEHTHLKLAVVLRTLHALRRKGYVVHRAYRQSGESSATWKPIRTVTGKLVPEFTQEDSNRQIDEYLKTHTVTKVQPGYALGVYKSCHWDHEL